MEHQTGPTPVRSMEQDPLMRPTRLGADICQRDPLIVVGLPRSGSSFFSHILSQIPNWYVFDDLYLHRRAKQIGAQTPLTEKDLKALMFFLGWQIRARLRFGLYAIPNVTEEEVPQMDEALVKAFTAAPGSWAELQEEWMRRLAHRAGCDHWGYKMPGAFRQIPQLLKHYPQARFIYIMRNPYKVLASYKNMPMTSQDGDPRRYHPVAYAYYWRMAARSYKAQAAHLGDRVRLVQFETLTKSPQQVAEQIAAFLDAQPPAEVDVPPKPNTSFSGEGQVTNLTGFEKWIVNVIAGAELEGLGYKRERADFRASDSLDFLKTCARFTSFHVSRIVQPSLQRLQSIFGSDRS